MPIPRPARAPRPTSAAVKISNLDEIAIGQRSHRHVWQPLALVTGAAWVSVLTNTGDIAIREDAPQSAPPPGAVGIKVLVTITSNTVTAQNLQFLAFSEKTATTIPTGAAVAWSFPNAVTGNVVRMTLDCPLVNGNLRWALITSGTPRYDVNLYQVGWILS